MSAEPRRTATVGVVDLTVRFGSTSALDRVAFDLTAGEIVGLVGPNGAGKTTLLRVLATLLLPSSGRAEVLGFDVAHRPLEVRRRIGYLPDFAGLYQDMRVTEYLRFFADANGLDRASRARFVERALVTSQLEDRAGDFIDQLSRGMRGKLAFAATLAGDPPLLLLDEPLSGLDPLARGALRDNLSGLRDEHRTILISSHMLSDLELLCDRVLLIDRGRLIEEASEEAIGYELELAKADDDPTARLAGIDSVLSVTPGSRPGVLRLEIEAATAAPSVMAAVVALGPEVRAWKPSG
ncbi:MAG: ABC transporter ATP-binding protein, partial [Deltaproteobacteria bacterium]|nr:ABC transporter ATP-binding protein [Deltaproteobacteria bacterium]